MSVCLVESDRFSVFNLKYVGIEIGNNLFASLGQFQVVQSCWNVRKNSIPIKLGVILPQISRRLVSQDFISADFLKFVEQGTYFSQVIWVAQLTDQIGGSSESRIIVSVLMSFASWNWEASQFNIALDLFGIN